MFYASEIIVPAVLSPSALTKNGSYALFVLTMVLVGRMRHFKYSTLGHYWFLHETMMNVVL